MRYFGLRYFTEKFLAGSILHQVAQTYANKIYTQAYATRKYLLFMEHKPTAMLVFKMDNNSLGPRIRFFVLEYVKTSLDGQ